MSLKRLLFIVLAAVGAGMFASPVGAGGPHDQLTPLLQAGEFSRAERLIESLPQQDRDAARLRLAMAQIAGGASGGAARTFGSLSGSSSARVGNPSLSDGARGGGVIADFTTLMDLIRETIDPDSWDDAEGNGTMAPFPAGVLVDSQGTLRLAPNHASTAPLERARREALADRGNRDVRRASALRKVSLTRLERQLQFRAAAGLPPTDEMQHVAGLYAITHLFIYPETGDVVIAGPADDWVNDGSGHHLAAHARIPTLWLDDWIEVWRNHRNGNGSFYCSIEPRPANLRRTVDFLAGVRENGITGSKDTFLSQLQDTLGQQDLVVEGISPRSRAAHVILQADYHMKRVGLGLEPSVLGVPSYLELLGSAKHGEAANRILRWWFTLKTAPVITAADELAYEIPRDIVQLQSENPRVNETGRREATGQRDPLNHRFATLFTKHYEELARRYPVYYDLRNVMHWAVVGAILDRMVDRDQLAWHGDFYTDRDLCPVQYGPKPGVVDSVVNYHRFKSGRVVYAVSGGVEISAKQWLANVGRLQRDRYEELPALHQEQARPAQCPPEQWWWD